MILSRKKVREGSLVLQGLPYMIDFYVIKGQITAKESARSEQPANNLQMHSPPPPSQLCATASSSLQLLLASLLKLVRVHQVHLPHSTCQERLSAAAAVWPHLWAAQLAQSAAAADPRALMLLMAATSNANSIPSNLCRLLQAINEVRALALDHAEWGMVENIVHGGKGRLSLRFSLYCLYLKRLISDYVYLDDDCGSVPSALVSLRASSRISLARYHLVSRPADPARLPRVLLAVAALQTSATHETVVKYDYFLCSYLKLWQILMCLT